MNSWFRVVPALLLLACSCGAWAEFDRTDFERSFIGREWVPQASDFDHSPLSEPCTYVASSNLQQSERSAKLGIDSFRCEGQALELLTQLGTNNRLKVLDALLLSKLKHGERYMTAGDCELDGRTDTDFVAIVNLGKREKVNWKTGVRAAWLPNAKTQRFEPISTRHIVCWRPTPP